MRHFVCIYLLCPTLLLAAATSIFAGESAIVERDITFRSGDVELAGTMITPRSRNPVPGIVFLHGSGPHTREGFRAYAEEFARLGIASLFFDKRGSGESGGSWTSSSIDDLAADALAAVAWLKARNEIDPDRIGFWGISQAGWVGPLAAANSEDVAFMIVISGGGASPRESEMSSWKDELEGAGLSSTETLRATEILERYFDYLATGSGRSELLARLAEIRGTALSPLADRLERILPSEENRPNWSWVGSYDPTPDIAALDIPLLLLFGDRDQAHPSDLAIARWRSALAQNRAKTTIVSFPGAGHGIRMRAGHTGEGPAPFADGYREVQLGWLWLHAVSTAE